MIEEKRLGGGQEYHFRSGGSVSSANLTPHPTGLGAWSLEQFVARFRGYREAAADPPAVEPGYNTVMPWLTYSALSDEDLAALYAFLRTAAPVENKVVAWKVGASAASP